ncbi:MAG: TetR/AcrR family transcriptional regulator [Jhaorihella sp.]
MARIRKSAADRKSEIVEAAIRLAAEIGPDRVTARHLAEAVGISQPAVFRHFPTKSDIWRSVGETVVRHLTEETLPANGDPLDMLAEMIRRHLDHIARTPAIPAILFSRELHVANEAMRAYFERGMADRRAAFAALVDRGRATGGIRADVAPADAAALILAAMQGLAVRWSLENRSFDLTGEGMRLIGAMVDGFAPRTPERPADGAAIPPGGSG